MKCSVCNFDNSELSIYCGQCGRKLHPEIASRRDGTFMFIDISNFTPFAEKSDPEEVKIILENIFQAVCQIINRYGGTFHQLIGDSVLALFGIPKAIEKQGERALNTAIEIRKLSPIISDQLGFKLQFHIGIHSGEVFCGDISVINYHAFSTIGDPINVTSRIESICPTGEIYLSDKVYKSTKHAFHFEKLQKVKLKGKTHPITLYKLIDRRTKRLKQRGIQWITLPFVGRKKEFQMINDHFCNKKKTLRGILIKGEPGIGKTRFFEEYRNMIEKKTIIIKTRCLPYGIDSYWTLRDLVKNILFDENENQNFNKTSEELHKIFSSFKLPHPEFSVKEILNFIFKFENTDIEENKKNLLFSCINHLIKYRLKKKDKSYCIVIEDLHWSFPPLISFLEEMLEDLKDKNLFIVFITRTLPSFPSTKKFLAALVKKKSFLLLDLQPLSLSESKDLIKFILKIENIPKKLKNLIINYSEGNPFYLEEVIKMLFAKGVIWEEKGKWIGKDSYDFNIPKTLKEIIMSRFDMLELDERNFLETASVNGVNFWDKMIYDITENCKSDILNRIEKYGFIKYAGKSSFDEILNEYIFKHLMIRETIYNYQLKIIRKGIHKKIFQWCKTRYKNNLSIYSLLAYHADKAELWEESIKYYYLISQDEMNKYSFEVAKISIERLFQIVQDNSLKINKNKKYKYNLLAGNIYINIGDHQKALLHLKAAEKFTNIKLQKATVNYRLAEFYISFSKYSEAEICIVKALKFLNLNKYSEKERKLILDILNIQSSLNYLVGNISKSFKDLKKAEVFIDNKNEQEIMFHKSQLSDLLHETGKINEALQLRLDVEKIAVKNNFILSLSTNYNNIGIIYDDLGDIEKSIQSHRKSYEIEKQTGYKLGQAISSFNIGSYYLDFGLNREAKKWYNRYHKLNIQIHNTLGEGYYNIGLSDIEFNKRNHEKSIDYMKKSRNIFKKVKSRQNEFYCLYDLIYRCIEIGKKKEVKNFINEIKTLYQDIEDTSPVNVIQSYKLITTYYEGKMGNKNSFKKYFKELKEDIKRIPEFYNKIDTSLMLFKIFTLSKNKKLKFDAIDKAMSLLIASFNKIPKETWKEAYVRKYLSQKIITSFKKLKNNIPESISHYL